MAITNFKGPNKWLSNFELVPITYNGIYYPSTEHAYMAQKTTVIELRMQIAAASTPSKAKKLGRALKLRPDWELIKLQVMEDVLRIKFNQEPYKSKLIATGNEELIEGNTWCDQIWGQCRCQKCLDSGIEGQNNLGKLLMKIRSELQA